MEVVFESTRGLTSSEYLFLEAWVIYITQSVGFTVYKAVGTPDSFPIPICMYTGQLLDTELSELLVQVT